MAKVFYTTPGHGERYAVEQVLDVDAEGRHTGAPRWLAIRHADLADPVIIQGEDMRDLLRKARAAAFQRDIVLDECELFASDSEERLHSLIMEADR